MTTLDKYCPVCGKRVPPNHTHKRRAPSRRDQEWRKGYDWQYQQARQQAIERDQGCCQICGLKVAVKRDGKWRMFGGETDHIIPLSQGGTNQPENIQTLCKECHREKTKHTPRRQK